MWRLVCSILLQENKKKSQLPFTSAVNRGVQRKSPEWDKHGHSKHQWIRPNESGITKLSTLLLLLFEAHAMPHRHKRSTTTSKNCQTCESKRVLQMHEMPCCLDMKRNGKKKDNSKSCAFQETFMPTMPETQMRKLSNARRADNSTIHALDLFQESSSTNIEWGVDETMCNAALGDRGLAAKSRYWKAVLNDRNERQHVQLSSQCKCTSSRACTNSDGGGTKHN